MPTKEIQVHHSLKEIQVYHSLPEEVKQAILALSILTARIRSLPQADRDDLFKLLDEWGKADDAEERQSIHRAMEEILAQIPASAGSMPVGAEMSRGLKKWAEHVGFKIRQLRDKAGWTQEELAKRTGLPQSHISRLENAEHSATNMTLTKIAEAFGVPLGELDPSAD